MKNLLAIAMTTASALSLNAADHKDFNYHVDRFADIEVLRYEVPGFSELTPAQKEMIYYLSQAAQAGRDIIWDQNGRYNLPIRNLFENIYTAYSGPRDSKDFKAFEEYLKRLWFSNGIYHHYSNDKFKPEFSRAFLEEQIAALPSDKKPADQATLLEVIFNPDLLTKKVNQDGDADIVATSAGNLYEGVTQAEVEDYYNALKKPGDPTPVSYGLNARVVKKDG